MRAAAVAAAAENQSTSEAKFENFFSKSRFAVKILLLY
jgi:hypothetical protein